MSTPIQLERPESCSAGSADDGVPNTDGIGSVRVNGSCNLLVLLSWSSSAVNGLKRLLNTTLE